jgi:iron complex outermembrane receptor protein
LTYIIINNIDHAARPGASGKTLGAFMNRFGPSLFVIAAALGAVASPALAETREDAAEATNVSQSIEEVVVTAQRREEKLQNAPLSILAFTTKRIDQLNAVSLDNLERAAPGVTFAVNRAKTVGQIGMRGVVDYASTPGYDARVGAYLDGVYIKRSYADNQTLLGMERVEFLRGPQGTTFGMNTDAGAISFTTRKPDLNAPGGEAVAEVGGFGHRRFGGRVNLPLIKDKLALAVTLTSETSDGFIDNIYLNRTYGGVDRKSARAQLRYQPNENVDINLQYSGLWDDNKSIWTIGVWSPAQWASFQRLYPKFNGLALPGALQIADSNDQGETGQSQFFIASVDWRLSDGLKLSAISAYQNERFQQISDATDLPAPGRVYDLNQTSRQFSQELRLSSDAAQPLSFIAGLYFQDGRNGANTRYYLGSEFAALTFWSRGVAEAVIPGAVSVSPLRLYNNTVILAPATVSDQSYAAYGSLLYRPASNVEIEAGGRYSVIRKTLEHFSENDPLRADPTNAANLAYASFAQFPDQTDKQTFKAFTPKVSISYHPTSDTTLFASASKGFKAGGWNTGVITQAVFSTGLRLGDESSVNYEMGLKSEWFDRRLRFNVTGFWEDFTGFQVSQWTPTVNGSSVARLANAGKARSKGVEAEVEAIPLQGLSLTANFTYNRARFTDFANCNGLNTSCTGNRLPYAPDYKLYLAGLYERPITGALKAFVGGGYAMETSSYSNVVNVVREYIPRHSAIEAKIGVAALDDRWSLTVFGNNLADRLNQVYSQNGAYGDQIRFFREPRSYGATFKLRY